MARGWPQRSPVEISRFCEGHGLAGWLHHELTDELEPALAEPPRAAALRSAAQALRVKTHLGAVLSCLREAGVVPLVLKGPPLGARLYPSPWMRLTSDVDLVLRPRDFAPATAALSRAGWRRAPATDALYPDSWRHHDTWHGPVTVELHRWLLTSLGRRVGAAEQVWPDTEVDRLDDQPFRILSRERELLYLALHASAHVCERLSWLLDLHLLARQPGLDVGRFQALARADDQSGVAWLALDAAARLFDDPRLADVARPLEPAPWRRWLSRRFLSVARMTAPPPRTRRAGRFVFKALYTPTPKRWWRFVGARLRARSLPLPKPGGAQLSDT